MDTSSITEHMEVVGSDGKHVGTVDKIEGTSLKLTKSDASSGGTHHYIGLDAIQGIASGKVQLSMPAESARQHWQSEAPRAMPGM